MPHATITIHLPSHRRKSLKIEGDTLEAIEAYDANIADYIRFLKTEALKKSIDLRTDHKEEAGSSYSISALSHDDKTAAHDWLHEQPDLWNWIP